MKSKEELIIWGATGQSIVLEEFLCEEYDICAVFDNNKNVNSPFDDVPIYYNEEGFIKWYSQKTGTCNFIVAIGGNGGKDREEVSNYLTKYKLNPISAINKNSTIAKNVKLGKNIQIMMGACIAAQCTIGDNVIINTSASIDHECIIGNACHIAPGAILAGKITIEEYSFIGTGAVVLPNVKIGKECVVGAGSVVTKNVPDYSIVYGNPAKIKGKTNE
jgi:sugar O-acyltransferase (sialic acid O-acetyltransferase NeuD family)